MRELCVRPETAMHLSLIEETGRLGVGRADQLRIVLFLRRVTQRTQSEPVPNKASVEGSGTDSSLVVSPPETAMAVDPSRDPRSILSLNGTVIALIAAPPITPVKTPASAYF